MISVYFESQPETKPLVGVDGLLEIDPRAAGALREEIDVVRQAGYDVRVSNYEDVAYGQPLAVVDMYKRLESYDDVLDEARKEVTGRLMSGVVLAPLFRPNNRDIYRLLELSRDRLMFGGDRSDSQAWHGMRGRALALETIVNAPLLRVSSEAEGLYLTMSGELDATLLEYKFDERAGALEGMNLYEATVAAEMDFSGKSEAVAKARAAERLEATRRFIEAPITQEFKDIVVNCTDSLGIRSRGEEGRRVLLDHLQSNIDKFSEKEIVMMSFGCGTARTVLSAAQAMKEQGVRSQILLLDQDPIALAAALQLAERAGVGDMVELHCQQLFDSFGRPLDLRPILQGRKLDVAEDSGLREYLPNLIYTNLAKQVWRHLNDGGIASTGNMNANRPQRRFLHGMMGWYPKVKMRTIAQNLQLLHQAGIPKDDIKTVVTKDGVYSLFYSVKS